MVRNACMRYKRDAFLPLLSIKTLTRHNAPLPLYKVARILINRVRPREVLMQPLQARDSAIHPRSPLPLSREPRHKMDVQGRRHLAQRVQSRGRQQLSRVTLDHHVDEELFGCAAVGLPILDGLRVSVELVKACMGIMSLGYCIMNFVAFGFHGVAQDRWKDILRYLCLLLISTRNKPQF